MAKKKPFALRLDADLLEAIEKWSSDEFRSTNGQIEWIIHQALLKAKRLPKGSPSENDKTDSPENETEAG